MLSVTAFSAASRSVLPVLGSLAARAALLKRASARLRSSLSSRSTSFSWAWLWPWVPADWRDRRLPWPAGWRAGSRPLSNGDVGSRNIRHRLDAFGILGALAVQPDLFHFGGAFRFVRPSDPQNSWRAHASCGDLRPDLTMHWATKGASFGRIWPEKRPFRAESAIVVKGRRLPRRLPGLRNRNSRASAGSTGEAFPAAFICRKATRMLVRPWRDGAMADGGSPALTASMMQPLGRQAFGSSKSLDHPLE